LAEARRVLASGGRFVLMDVENDLWIIDSDDQLLARTMVRALADTIANPWIGRSGRALLLHSGFEDVTVEFQPHTMTAPTAALLENIVAAALACGAVNRQLADANPFYVISARQL